MNCILLLLLLGCCGGSDNGGNRSGRGCNGTSSFNNGYGYDGGSARNSDCGYNRNSVLENGNNIGGYRTSDNDDCGCQDNVSSMNDGCGCGQDGDFRSNSDNSGQNPPGWQTFPEISRRDNDCGCDN